MMLISVAMMTAAMLAHRAASDARGDRPGRRLAAPAPALRDGVFGRRRIYRRGRLFARGRTARAARTHHLLGVGSERGRRAARGRSFGADRQPRRATPPRQLGVADSVLGRRRARRQRLDRAFDHAGIPRFPAPAGARDASRVEPLRHALEHHRAGIARGFSISALGSITYYVGITYVPSFLTSAGALAERARLWLSTIAAVAVILVTPLVGWLVRPHRPPSRAARALRRQRSAADDHVRADGERFARSRRCSAR